MKICPVSKLKYQENVFLYFPTSLNNKAFMNMIKVANKIKLDSEDWPSGHIQLLQQTLIQIYHQFKAQQSIV